jgi:hypothetical protein
MERQEMKMTMSKRTEDKLEYAKIWKMPRWLEIFSQGDMYEISLQNEKMYARFLRYDFSSLTPSQKKLVVDNGMSSIEERAHGDVLKIVKRIPS